MRPKKSLGQNFLKDSHYRRKVIDSLSLSPTDVVLEIGPGLGALTESLVEKCAELILVEKDDQLAKDLREKFLGRKNIEIITGDFLKIALPLFPPLQKGGRGDLKTVGNLPYNVASQIFIRLIEYHTHFSDLYLMFQKEMAVRFVAKPSTKDYGLLTLWATIYTDAKILFHLPPNAFFPVPKVDSSFVHFKIKDTPLLTDEEAPKFFTLMRRLFQQRRKTIQSVVKELKGLVPPTARAEAMTVTELIDLSRRY